MSSDTNCYKIDKKLFVLISNEKFKAGFGLSDRSGTKRDHDNLKKLFRSMDFIVETYNECTGDQINDIFKEVSRRKDLFGVSLLVIAILSHGDEGIIYGTDGFTLAIDRLTSYFKGDLCPAMADKPKFFIIQACRGDKYDHGSKVYKHDAILSNNIDKIPIESDVLIGYSTVPGYFSWRNSSNGSWYIQALVDIFTKYYQTEDVLSMLVRVNQCVASNFRSNTGDNRSHDKLQIPSFVCMLRRKLFLSTLK